jgi:hypothetical protein
VVGEEEHGRSQQDPSAAPALARRTLSHVPRYGVKPLAGCRAVPGTLCGL